MDWFERMAQRCAPGVLALLLLAGGCDSGGGTEPEPPGDDGDPVVTRPFRMGFTDFPHAVSIEALVAAYEVLESDADLVVEHFDGGVPWNEALEGEPYPESFQAELQAKVSLLPPGKPVYLAVTPIAFGRDGLALYQGEAAGQALPPPWDERSFDHPDVVTAFGNHVERMIEVFQPTYLAFAIEANLLLASVPEEWDAFLALAEATYDRVKEAHPDLPTFVSIQGDGFHRDPVGQAVSLAPLMPFTDLVAVSAYPYFEDPDPGAVPASFFGDIRALAPGKPFAIAETGWPAEDMTAPAPVSFPATPTDQRDYLAFVLEDADAAGAEFVTWFFTRDFDDAWATTYAASPDAPVIRLFRDTGLLDGGGIPRPAHELWLEWLARPLGGG